MVFLFWLLCRTVTQVLGRLLSCSCHQRWVCDDHLYMTGCDSVCVFIVQSAGRKLDVTQCSLLGTFKIAQSPANLSYFCVLTCELSCITLLISWYWLTTTMNTSHSSELEHFQPKRDIIPSSEFRYKWTINGNWWPDLKFVEYVAGLRKRFDQSVMAVFIGFIPCVAQGHSLDGSSWFD